MVDHKILSGITRFIRFTTFQMQARFDGQFGFPGGLLDKLESDSCDEHPVDGLNRELEEEIAFDVKKYALKQVYALIICKITKFPLLNKVNYNLDY